MSGKHQGETFGTKDLCAWQDSKLGYLFSGTYYGNGKVHDLVATGVAGGYLRTYEVRISHKACRLLINRWLERLKAGSLWEPKALDEERDKSTS